MYETEYNRYQSSWRLLEPWMWRCVVWSIVTEVSEECAVSIFGVIIYHITQRHVLKILIIVVTTTIIVYLVSVTVFMLEGSVSKNFVLWYRPSQVSLEHGRREPIKVDSHHTERRQETDHLCNIEILFNAVLHDFRNGHEVEHRREG
jgi:hypothetical protein